MRFICWHTLFVSRFHCFWTLCLRHVNTVWPVTTPTAHIYSNAATPTNYTNLAILFVVEAPHPVFAQAQHSKFMLFTNIHGLFTFFCKNISTDPHPGMSRFHDSRCGHVSLLNYLLQLKDTRILAQLLLSSSPPATSHRCLLLNLPAEVSYMQLL